MPKAVFKADEIPPQGITASDLAIKEAGAPSKPLLEPQAPEGPQPPTVEQVLADIYKRLDQQGTLLVQIADRIIAPQNPTQQTGSLPVTIMGIPVGSIGDLINAIRGATSGGGGAQDYYAAVGKRVVDGVTDSAVKRIISGVGSEAAKHVTG